MMESAYGKDDPEMGREVRKFVQWEEEGMQLADEAVLLGT